MVKENGEVYVNSLVTELLNSARKQDWDRVDKEIIPRVSRLNDNDASQFSLDIGLLLSGMIHRDWEDPNGRDAIASALTVVNFPRREIFETIYKRMLDLVEHDPERFPAGRAAMFLWKYRDDKELKDKMQEGINQFKNRKEISEWKKDLVENILGIGEILR